LVLVAFNVGGLRERLLGAPDSGENASIAVLPLKNLSADREQDFFASGMTEALITQLGKISTLDVISHQSMLGYRDVTKSLPQIARELNVKMVLEGTVLRSGDKLRVTINLVQAAPERHLWAESFEVDPGDVLAVQSEVAREVARHVHAKLTPADSSHLATSHRVDPDAYEAYLLGRAHFYKPRTPANAARAKEYFQKTIAKDPTYAPAYASLAELYIWTGGAGTLTRLRDGDREAHALARQWAEKALQLDETLADAHNALAMVKQGEWDWSGAEREYQRAIELNPSYAVGHVSYAMHLYAMLRFGEAAAHARRAQQLDPASPFVNTWAGAAYHFAGREQDAMAALRIALEVDPGYYEANLVLARNHLLNGNHKEATAELDAALALNPGDPAILGALVHAHARAGNRAMALKLLDELRRDPKGPRPNPHGFALIWAYAGLGDKEQAFVLLERACEERRQRLTWLNVDPLLEPLRADPRFAEIVRHVGLPSAARANEPKQRGGT
jgi:TolB-like protein/Tfp pilus assembly protein PilF